MTAGLSPSDVVAVNILLSSTAVVGRNFGAMMVVGSSAIIDTNARMRVYTTLAGVASDFGTTAPEYSAAQVWFSQTPQPVLLYIGRWAQTATAGIMRGGALSASQQQLAAFQAITAGTFGITVDGGSAKAISGINLSGAVALTGVAALITTALAAATAGATCIWNGTQFVFTSATTGTASSATVLTAGAGQDLSTLLAGTTVLGAVPVPGIAAETPLAALNILATMTGAWYGCAFAAPLTDAQHLMNAAYIEGSSPTRLYFITNGSALSIDPTQTADLLSQLMGLDFSRTFYQYCSTNAYAAIESAAKEFSVNFTGTNTVMTLKFKQDPGIAAETLTETQAAALKAKNGNVFVNYANGAAIIQEGVMVGGRFFDEVHCLDALQNDVQTDLFNLLYQSTTKTPQTDPGVTTLVTQVEATLSRYVTNGFLAPGVWTLGGFGTLVMGQMLPKGYYVYAPPISTQSQALREARQSPLIQAAAKGSGAIHFCNVQISFNR
jgi:hypothetical protein